MVFTAELILPQGQGESRRASYRASKGQIMQVRRGVYVDSTDPEVVEKTVRAGWVDLVAQLCPEDSVVAYRTAGEVRPCEGEVFVVANVKARRIVPVGDYLTINIFPGDIATGVIPFNLTLSVSDRPRACLENLTRSSGHRKGVDKALGAPWVEKTLVGILQGTGEEGLNGFRDQAREVAGVIGLEKEFKQLEGLIRELLNTNTDGAAALATPLAIAAAHHESYDEPVINRFRALADYLHGGEFETVKFDYDKQEWRNLAFFEAYFSNYIEGTEFTIEEAEEIVFEGKVDATRPKDSHDILGTFEIVSDRQEMLHTPESADDLIGLIQTRHKRMMYARPEENPGEFKVRPNRAGNTHFVAPENVIGTLTQAMAIYDTMAPGFTRAVFIHFVVSECHPMQDGNGRLSRVFLNAELHSQGLSKIIVPTVHRESYLSGQRNASRQDRFRTTTKVLHQLHHYSSSLPWNDYGDLRQALREHMADSDEAQGLAKFNRVISQWRFNYPEG